MLIVIFFFSIKPNSFRFEPIISGSIPNLLQLTKFCVYYFAVCLLLIISKAMFVNGWRPLISELDIYIYIYIVSERLSGFGFGGCAISTHTNSNYPICLQAPFSRGPYIYIYLYGLNMYPRHLCQRRLRRSSSPPPLSQKPHLTEAIKFISPIVIINTCQKS